MSQPASVTARAGAPATDARGSELGTRARVARLIMENGPVTAAALGTTLGVTPSAHGYAAAASAMPGGDRLAPLAGGAAGEQLCQHHCPVAHVAARYPQLCEAETEAFGRLLGTPVQRLATIARGDGICTTHITAPPLTTSQPRKTDVRG